MNGQQLLEKQAMEMHDLSMSGQAQAAALGRLGKEILPIIDKWQNDELARGTGMAERANAMIQISLGIAASAIASSNANTAELSRLCQLDLADRVREVQHTLEKIKKGEA